MSSTAPSTANRSFLFLWLSSVLLFFILGVLSLQFEIYRWFPAFGFIGYTTLLLLLLTTMSKASQKGHYITISGTLIFFGAFVSLDIVISKEAIIADLVALEMEGLRTVLSNPVMIDNYVNILVILLNIFTSSVAGNALFYGLNSQNFPGKKSVI
ncbi:hypothetical protein [Endozoicomonas sp.]|uniref:hypothetical protein n=1 Tax=Endozoicomonas sp. TaxID=1892382 RepID=UPI00383B8063